jgi:Magnesium chelatase, subunit ChlI
VVPSSPVHAPELARPSSTHGVPAGGQMGRHGTRTTQVMLRWRLFRASGASAGHRPTSVRWAPSTPRGRPPRIWGSSGGLRPVAAPPSSPPALRRPPPHHRRCRRVGGGPRPLPGKVSLAHYGLLCVDELPECTGHILEALCQSLANSITNRSSRGHRRLVALAALARRINGAIACMVVDVTVQRMCLPL